MIHVPIFSGNTLQTHDLGVPQFSFEIRSTQLNHPKIYGSRIVCLVAQSRAQFMKWLLSVMSNFGCQLDYILNQPKRKLLGTPAGDGFN